MVDKIESSHVGVFIHIHPLALVNLILVGVRYSGSYRLQEADEVDVATAVPIAPHVSEAEEREELCLHSCLLLYLPQHSSGQVFTWGGWGAQSSSW